MPVSAGGRYRMTARGVRLHFTKGGAVDEAKNMKTGATHTPSEFAADRKRGRSALAHRRKS